MSPSQGSSVLIAVACIVMTVEGGSTQEALARAEVAAAANVGTVKQMAEALALAKVPVGIVLLERDENIPGVQVAVDRNGSTSVAKTMAVFAERHPEYRLEQRDAAIVISPRTAGWCTRPLRSMSGSIKTHGEIFDVLYAVYRAWSGDPSPYVPPGIVGTRGDPSVMYQTVVSLDMSEVPLEQALNEAVKQAPGVGWAMRETYIRPVGAREEKPIRGCNLALFDGKSWLETSWTLVVKTR